jgi:hypothetical protein
MNEKLPSNRSDDGSVSYKIGDECPYWLESSEYVHQQAIKEGWLDMQGKLTVDGFQAIVSEQEIVKNRKDQLEALTSKNRSVRGKLKLSGSSRKKLFFPSSSSHQNLEMYSARSASKKTTTKILKEIKAHLGKINAKFSHFMGEGEDCRLTIKIPNLKKDGTTSRTFRGTISDIKREFDDFVKQYD